MAESEPAPLASAVQLHDVVESDLPVFFEHQLDSEANRRAAFIFRDPTDREAFMTHWHKILRDETIIKKTISLDGQVVGNIVSFQAFGAPEVGYWIGRPYWGKGITTQALKQFLHHVTVRPLYAHVAKDNIGSIRVLEKCGFKLSGEDQEFSNVRGAVVEAFVLKLDD